MDTSFFGYILAAFSGAVFGVGGNLILQFLSSGKVTTEHLKKSDLKTLEESFNKHITRHEDCEKEYVKKDIFDQHLHDCPIKSVANTLRLHEIQHGKQDSEVSNRLKSIEKSLEDGAKIHKALTEGFITVDKKIDLLVQKFDLVINKGENK